MIYAPLNIRDSDFDYMFIITSEFYTLHIYMLLQY